MTKAVLTALIIALTPLGAAAESEFNVTSVKVTDWKAVFGRVEARDNIPARARLGGTLLSIDVEEGSIVQAGQVIAAIDDVKLGLQLQSVAAEIDALRSQLGNAKSELLRGEDLLKRGVTTTQRLDALRTQVSVLENKIEATTAQKRVIEQQKAEGAVLAPSSGTVLTVPVTSGAVIMPGEVVATIAGGGFFLRLAVPERHAAYLKPGLDIQIGNEGTATTGQLVKIYPQIENGRVIADVEVDGLSGEFVDARVLVRLPVGQSSALLVPKDMVHSRMGLDFVSVKAAGAAQQRVIVLGETHPGGMIEVLSGLYANEILVNAND